jgi:hypothetical protein
MPPQPLNKLKDGTHFKGRETIEVSFPNQVSEQTMLKSEKRVEQDWLWNDQTIGDSLSCQDPMCRHMPYVRGDIGVYVHLFQRDELL